MLNKMDPDILIVVLSTLVSLGLAFLGIEMANRPPNSDAARIRYRIAFIVLAALLILCSVWQAHRNKAEQDKLKTDAQNQHRQQELEYADLKNKLDTVSGFVAHPPAGLSQDQINAVVEKLKSSNTMSNEQLRDRANILIARITQLDLDSRNEEAALLGKYAALKPQDAGPSHQQEFDAVRTNELFTFKTQILQEYVYLFGEIGNRIPASVLQQAGYGEKTVFIQGWLWANGTFADNVDIAGTGTKLADLLKLLPTS
jgi:hypothetical protein